MEDDVDAPDSVDLEGDVVMEWDGYNNEGEDEGEDDDEKEDEEEDKDEDDGKEPWTIAQGEMVNTSADDADTMVEDEPSVLPEQRQEMEQGQDMSEHSPRTQPPAPSPLPRTPEPPPRPRTPETHTRSELEFLRLLTPQKHRPVAPTLREAEAAGNTSTVDVEQQLPSESADGDSLPDVPHPDVPLPDVPLPDVPLPDVPLPDVLEPEARSD
jgi:hypothetical protein